MGRKKREDILVNTDTLAEEFGLEKKDYSKYLPQKPAYELLEGREEFLDEKLRMCLQCLEDFKSKFAGNRICSRCKTLDNAIMWENWSHVIAHSGPSE